MNSVKSEIVEKLYKIMANSGDYDGTRSLLNLLNDCVVIRKSDLKDRLDTAVKPRVIMGINLYECITRLGVYTSLIINQESFDASGLSIDELKNTTESKLINRLDELEDYDS